MPSLRTAPVRLIAVALLAALALPSPTGTVLAARTGQTSTCPILQSTDFVIYGQTFKGGVTADTRSWMEHFFSAWRATDPDVHFQFVTATDAQVCTNLKANYPNLKMWVQPGGDAYDQQTALGAAGRANIAAFIAAGGAYFGTCAGAYYAAPDYWWEGKHYAHPYLLGAYPATLEGAISAIAPWPGHTLTTLSNGLHAVYYGGPTIGMSHTTAASLVGDAVASYASIPGNLPAVILSDHILLTSVHLEAFEGIGITELGRADRVRNYDYLAGLVNRAAATSFTLPSGGTTPDPTPTPDPTSPPSTTTVFSDGFENGLADWSVSGPGKPWVVSSVDPSGGTSHAYAKQPGVSTPTYLGRSFDLSAYDSATLTYDRRRIGLDGADEFAVEYYDGGWRTLEATGSKSADDTAYSRMTFGLPKTATAIRFTCLAGAVSEKCEVDMVSLIAQ